MAQLRHLSSPLNFNRQLLFHTVFNFSLKAKSMINLSVGQRLAKWLAVVALLGCGAAMAQSEPSLKQIYEAAQSGKIEQAQVMVQQVLIAHPNSAKAHYVQAELFGRQGQAIRGREALLMADKLAPGLPFAKPEAVQALRTQLAAKPSVPAVREMENRPANSRDASAPAASASAFPIGLGLALGGAAIAIAIFLLRKKPVPETTPQVANANFYAPPNPLGNGSGLSGPQTFGAGAAAAPAYAQAPGQTAYGQPASGQPAASGIGGRVMGGLATGLAVGAGVIAAQAIGKSLMGSNEHASQPANTAAGQGYQPLASNNDLGGQNFGVNDAGSWDDGGSSMADSGGGGDWDS
jgi:hypothetical protein